MNDDFVDLQEACPQSDLGTEWGIFDGRGVLAASYRPIRGAVHVWIFGKDDSSVERFLILKDENVARLFCEEVASVRGWKPSEVSPPDLDAMLKQINQ